MFETMLCLALASIALLGAIAVFNAVQPRVEAQAQIGALQGLLLDARMYLADYHSDQIGAMPEWSVQGDGRLTKGFHLQNNNVNPLGPAACQGATASNRVACIGAGGRWEGGTPNTPLLRFRTMRSLRFADVDGDGSAEWHIHSQDQVLRLGFALIPNGRRDLYGGGTGSASARWAACPFPSGNATPDTAIALLVAQQSMRVCRLVAAELTVRTEVLHAYCLGPDTTPPAGSFAGSVDGEVGLHVCMGVPR